MKLITWNVQWCRGVDQTVDAARVVAEAKRLADFDVLCLQEIGDNFPDPRLPGTRARTSSRGSPRSCPATRRCRASRRSSGRRRPAPPLRQPDPVAPAVQQTFGHLLPFPADPGVPGMPRIAVEAVVTAPFGDVRVITTHLEYYGHARRSAQVEALRAIYAEGAAHARDPSPTKDDGGPFESLRGRRDDHHRRFQSRVHDPLHARMTARSPTARRRSRTPGTSPTAHALSRDVSHLREGAARRPGVALRLHLPERRLWPRLRAVVVDGQTQVSDHQPVIVTLA